MVMIDPIYYINKGTRVQGPFYVSEVQRFLMAQRLSVYHMVSSDSCKTWEFIHAVPELIPQAMLTELDLSGVCG